MTYAIAIAAAELDAQMYAAGSTEIEQDADNHRILLRHRGEIVGTYKYRN